MQKALVLFLALAVSDGLKYNATRDRLPNCKGRKEASSNADTCSGVKNLADCEKTWCVQGVENIQCQLDGGVCVSQGPFCKEAFEPDFDGFRDGLLAWFKSESAAANWPNEVEGGAAASTSGSKFQVGIGSGHGATGNVKFIGGDTGVKVDFGPILTKDYTVCSVDRYTGGSKGRILDCNNKNWLHGHWASQVGVAHYQHWNTNSHRNGGNEDWLVMCGTDNRQAYLGSSPDTNIATNDGHSFGNGEHRLVTNYREKSNFAIMEVMVWKRQLTQAEIKATMQYLKDKLENGSVSPPEWKKCACEHKDHSSYRGCGMDKTCSCTGIVKYGYGDKWFFKESKGSIECSNSVFGDPFGGQGKDCQCASS